MSKTKARQAINNIKRALSAIEVMKDSHEEKASEYFASDKTRAKHSDFASALEHVDAELTDSQTFIQELYNIED